MQLDELYEQAKNLKNSNPEMKVTIDGEPPAFASWRGTYSELTIFPSYAEDVTAQEFFNILDDIIGGTLTFTGYEGGEYIMDSSTQVFGDHEDEIKGRRIVGLTTTGNLITQ